MNPKNIVKVTAWKWFDHTEKPLTRIKVLMKDGTTHTFDEGTESVLSDL